MKKTTKQKNKPKNLTKIYISVTIHHLLGGVSVSEVNLPGH